MEVGFIVFNKEIFSLNIFQELKKELFNGEDIYESFRSNEVDFGYPHTNLVKECVQKIFEIIDPKFWLEIGSMLGGSAIKVGQHIKENNLDCRVACIDPFCGDVNMWCWDKEIKEKKTWSFLKIKDGSPTIRERFMANVCHHGFEEIILPIPATCIVGVNILKRLRRENRISHLPEVIYLDSSHQEKETFLEIDQSWEILEKGGILFGDDWGWPGLSSDVKKFASVVKPNRSLAEKLGSRLTGSTFEDEVLLYGNHWFLCKDLI
jgi:predicted O-methyltransferase YrrM